jgi:hypothetical protein
MPLTALFLAESDDLALDIADTAQGTELVLKRIRQMLEDFP